MSESQWIPQDSIGLASLIKQFNKKADGEGAKGKSIRLLQDAIVAGFR